MSHPYPGTWQDRVDVAIKQLREDRITGDGYEKAREEFSELYAQELAAGQLLPSKNFFGRQKNKLLMYGTIEDVVGIIKDHIF